MQCGEGLCGYADGAGDGQAFLLAEVARVVRAVAQNDVAVAEGHQFVHSQLRPGFVGSKGLCGNNGHTVVRRGNSGKIHGHVVVDEVRLAEGGLADDVVQQGAGVGKQDVSVGEHEVE